MGTDVSQSSTLYNVYMQNIIVVISVIDILGTCPKIAKYDTDNEPFSNHD